MTDPLHPYYRKAQSEYNYQPSDSEAILRVTSYHRADLDSKVINFASSEHDHIRNSTLSHSSKPSRLGQLSCLPLELLLEVLLNLDVRSVFRFRHVNAGAAKAIESLPEYNLVVRTALPTVCAILRTGLATRRTLYDIIAVLRSKTCELCGSSGNFLWLFTLKRCCFRCITRNHALRVMRLSDAWTLSELNPTHVRALRRNGAILYSSPGTYSVGSGYVTVGRWPLIMLQDLKNRFDWTRAFSSLDSGKPGGL
jgi:hypothetical protein